MPSESSMAYSSSFAATSGYTYFNQQSSQANAERDNVLPIMTICSRAFFTMGARLRLNDSRMKSGPIEYL